MYCLLMLYFYYAPGDLILSTTGVKTGVPEGVPTQPFGGARTGRDASPNSPVVSVE